MNWKMWLKGLLSAIIGGVSNSVVLLIADPMTYNLQAGIGKLATVAGTTALISAAMYLKQSPVPTCDQPKNSTAPSTGAN